MDGAESCHPAARPHLPAPLTAAAATGGPERKLLKGGELPRFHESLHPLLPLASSGAAPPPMPSAPTRPRCASPGAARAVGRANGANPIPIVVPCHRVIGSDGSLTGFGGGLEAKSRLLEIEGRRLPF